MKALLLVLLLTGCATTETRQLTAEQDRQAAEACRGGCVLFPAAAWAKIQAIIKVCSGQGV